MGGAALRAGVVSEYVAARTTEAERDVEGIFEYEFPLSREEAMLLRSIATSQSGLSATSGSKFILGPLLQNAAITIVPCMLL